MTRKTIYWGGAILFAVFQFDIFVTFAKKDDSLFYAAWLGGNALGVALILDGLFRGRAKIWNFIKRLRRD